MRIAESEGEHLTFTERGNPVGEVARALSGLSSLDVPSVPVRVVAM